MAGVVLTSAAPLAERILSEGPIGLGEAARLFERRAGKPVHTATLTRWAAKGVRAPDGSRVRLEAVWIGNALFTSRAALVRFVESQQPSPPATTAPPTPARRQRAAAAAAAELERMGA
jgi:hypothetical protein